MMNNQNFLHILKNRFGLVAIGLMLLLSACGNASATQAAETVISGAQTAVAETVTSQPITLAAPTATPSPTATSTYIIPTAIVVTATSFSSNSSWVYSTCEDSTYVKDITIPDETVLSPAETFVKTWRLKNTGNCTWTDYFSIVFISGDDMDGADTAIDLAVPANKKADVSVSLTAPDEAGTYTGYWQLADEYGYTFGEVVSVTIIVVEPTATSAPTSTGVPTVAEIPSPTATPMPEDTDTPLPTETATEVPTATPTPE